jgi:Flp pilus assembly protein TadG
MVSMKSKKNQRGVAAVETALIATFILLPLTFGLAEFGRAIFYYESLTKGARVAARYAVINQISRPSTYLAEANALARCGLTNCTGVAADQLAAPSIIASNVTVVQLASPVSIPVPTGAPVNSYGRAEVIVVTINYTLPSLLRFKMGSLFTFSPITAAMMVTT